MNTPKLPPLTKTEHAIKVKSAAGQEWQYPAYSESDMQAYALAAIEAQGVPDEQRTRNLLARYENQWHRMGELWERCQGKGWSEAESKEFARLRDELTPATRALLLASAPPAPQAAVVQQEAAAAWQQGYAQGVIDERISEANIGIAGFDAKVNPARQNPYTHPAQQAKPQPLSDKEADRMTERFYLNGRPVPAPYRLSLVRATERHYGIKE